jgi:replicative DNA helicase
MTPTNTTQLATKDSFNFSKYGKLPPQAIELEAAVLGALMIEGDKIDDVIDIIPSGECFYNNQNQLIYTTICTLYKTGKSFDFITVGQELKRSDKLEAAGGNYYITTLTRDVVSSANIEEHARIVMEKYIARELIRTSGEVLSEAYNDSADVFDLLDKASNFGTTLLDKIIVKQYQHISAPLRERLMEMSKLSDKSNGIIGVATGFDQLDKITSGFSPGQLIVLAARPSVGKTAFLLNIAVNAMTKSEKQTAIGIFSLEMSKSELVDRVLANTSEIPLTNIRNNQVQHHELEKLFGISEQFNNYPLYIDDAPVLTTLQLRAKAKKMVRKNGVQMIIIDYLQLMTGEKERGGNREQEISKISRELKILAKQLQIPIIALSQMSRQVEGRSDNKPKLSDIRESGAIEQDADTVIFLYSNSKEDLKKEPFRINERHLMIAKNRNGQLADLTFEFNGPFQRFERERVYSQDIDWTPVEPKATIVRASNVTTIVSAPTFEQIKAAEQAKIDMAPEIDPHQEELPF